MSKINPLSVVISTREINQDYIKHVSKMFSHPKTEVIVYQNNEEFSLPQLYNKGLLESKNEIVVFMHDDLIIETPNLTPKILRLFEDNSEYGIIGVAGTNNLINGMWWQDRESMQGQVSHEHQGKRHTNKYSNTFGENLKEVVVIDGLFMCVHKGRIKHNFNEEFQGFHFYDLPICLENYLDGVKIGVTTKIKLVHKSIGVVNKKWEKNKLLFEALYEKKLPIRI
ncbi:glycosyltransferase [Flavobacterium sp.]|uniref:glycosyltransferase n=1 Tax=Flavobacterium sp. TaxID=239 RepID=UPI0038D16A16